MRARSIRHGRLAVTLLFMAIGVALILAPLFAGWQWSRSGLLVDLGSELLGLALVVSILDWFFERRRLQADGRRLAWEMFHSVERVVWVWQGGPFRLETDELLGLLSGVSDDDRFAIGTENLLLGLGIRARELLKGERRVIRSIGGFHEALSELASLARLGEGKKPSAGAVRTALTTSAETLAEILDLSAFRMPTRLIRGRSASIEAQDERYSIGRRAAES